MIEVGSEFRRRARSFANREHPTATAYPESFREEALVIARERRAHGVPIARIASELGLQARTLALWLRRKRSKRASKRAVAPKRRVGRLRRVRLASDSISSCAVSSCSSLSVSVGAVRVEGLDLERVVLLVRALS